MYLKEINEKVKKVIEVVTSITHVKEIYLFGSLAYGIPDKDSDLDICIIIYSTERKIELLRRIRYSLLPHINVPLDLIIHGEEDFNARSKLSSTLEFKIVQEGKKIYG